MLLTVADMVTIFGAEEMLQIAGTGPRDQRGLDEPRIDEAVASAIAMVTGYVAARHPGVSETPMLKGFAADIARYRLRGKGGQQTAMSDVVQKRYDDAVARLRDIAAGRLALDVPGGTDASTGGEFTISASMPVSRLPAAIWGWR